MLIPLLAASLLAGEKTPTIKALYERCRPSVVSIETDKGTGTGFFYGDGKTVVTCLHVVFDASSVVVRDNRGKTWRPKRIGFDVAGDIAVLSLGADSGHVGLPHAPSQGVEIGDEILVIGDPQGLRASLSTGVVGGLRSVKGVPKVQITAPISQGSSGGPVLDRRGRVIGVVASSLIEGQNLNMAISTQVVRWVLTRRDAITFPEFVSIVASARSEMEEAAQKAAAESEATEGELTEKMGESSGADELPKGSPEARTALTKKLTRIYAGLYIANDRWTIAWSESMAPEEAVVMRLNRCRKELKVLVMKHLAELRTDRSFRESGLPESARSTLIQTLTEIETVCDESYEAELAWLSLVNGDKEKLNAANERQAELEDIRSTTLETFQDQVCGVDVGLSRVEFYEEMPATVFGSSILSSYDAFLDYDAPDSLTIRAVWATSQFEVGDLITGITTARGGIYENVESWQAIWNYYSEQYAKDPAIVLSFRVVRDGLPVRIELPDPSN